MSFILPSQYKSPNEVPKPSSPDVRISVAPKSILAVTSFTWTASKSQVDEHTRMLKDALARDSIELAEPADSPPILMRFFLDPS